MSLVLEIKKCLEKNFENALIDISDPMQDETHLEAVIVSDDFQGKTLLQQHRMVMHLLKQSFETNLHALKLKTYTFKTWNSQVRSIL